MKLKTLNDLETIAGETRHKSIDGITPQRLGIVEIESLRQETIRWIKEDKKILKIINPYQYKVFDGLTKLWMKRLNITEEDLK